MFSVLSRLTKSGDGKNVNAPLPMSSSLQKKFSRGVDYNMKILIKGDRNVGKSCLLQRLQGGPFVEEYIPTDEIQVAPIHWKYKDTEHIIKVEVWEVVDKGRTKKKSQVGLKIDNSFLPATDSIEIPPLDATFLDVYANASGVIMMLDITKTWTFEYVKREISTIPPELPVIVLGNHCDMHHHREINLYQIEMFLSSVKSNRTGALRYAETSMRNGFGLRLLHKFFNIPFLQLQRNTLINQLSVNTQEMRDAALELDELEKSEVANYELFLERVSSKRKQEIDASVKNTVKISSDKSPSIVLGGGKPIVLPNANPLSQTSIGLNLNKSDMVQTKLKPNQTNNFDEKQINVPVQPKRDNEYQAKPKNDIDDFCPGVLDNSFLDDFSGKNTAEPKANYNGAQHADSDSDGENGVNPLVTGIQDDLESDDDTPSMNKLRVNETIASTNYFHESAMKPSRLFDESEYKHQFEQVNKTPNPTYFDKSDERTDLYGNFNRGYREPNDLYDSSVELAQPAGYDSSPTWPLDSSIRRSPEGGEGTSPRSEIKKEKKSKEEKKHKKSKKSKDKDKDKTSSKERDSDKSKDKERKPKEKKHKKKNSESNLEDFLNDGEQESYEAL